MKHPTFLFVKNLHIQTQAKMGRQSSGKWLRKQFLHFSTYQLLYLKASAYSKLRAYDATLYRQGAFFTGFGPRSKGSLKYIEVIIPGCCKHSVSCLGNAHFIWTICCRHIAAQSLLQLQAGLRCSCLKYLQMYPLSTLHTR